jgi:hypothetical protein
MQRELLEACAVVAPRHDSVEEHGILELTYEQLKEVGAAGIVHRFDQV